LFSLAGQSFFNTTKKTSSQHGSDSTDTHRFYCHRILGGLNSRRIRLEQLAYFSSPLSLPSCQQHDSSAALVLRQALLASVSRAAQYLVSGLLRPVDGEHLCSELHHLGVPLHLLYLVFERVSESPVACRWIACEMVARALKKILRRVLSGPAKVSPETVQRHLDWTLKPCPDADHYWKVVLRAQLCAMFGGQATQMDFLKLRAHAERHHVTYRLNQLIALTSSAGSSNFQSTIKVSPCPVNLLRQVQTTSSSSTPSAQTDSTTAKLAIRALGSQHWFAQACSLRACIARLHDTDPCEDLVDQLLSLAKNSSQPAQSQQTPVSIFWSVAALHCLAQAYHQKKDALTAQTCYRKALELLQDTPISSFQQHRTSPQSEHPIYFFLLAQLAESLACNNALEQLDLPTLQNLWSATSLGGCGPDDGTPAWLSRFLEISAPSERIKILATVRQHRDTEETSGLQPKQKWWRSQTCVETLLHHRHGSKTNNNSSWPLVQPQSAQQQEEQLLSQSEQCSLTLISSTAKHTNLLGGIQVTHIAACLTASQDTLLIFAVTGESQSLFYLYYFLFFY
jgi:tetratricopeptide (TPR) repeat protein